MSNALDRQVAAGEIMIRQHNAEQAHQDRAIARETAREVAKDQRDARMNSMIDSVRINGLIDDIDVAYKKLRKQEAETAYYKNLLTKDMLEIANENGDFKETYHKQQELLGSWMVSQRAFKEIAIKFGLELGKTKEEVVAEGFATEIKVLDGETEHGNNLKQSEDDPWAAFYAPRIKTRFGIK